MIGVRAASALDPLTVDECLRLLAGQRLGRLGFIQDGAPQVLPLNYLLHKGVVVLRIGYGATLDAVHRSPVAFEVDAIDSDRFAGWSVVVHGSAEEVWKPEELAELRRLGLRPWAPGRREHFVLIWPSSITGRRIG